jgi:hypothetical protein
MIMLESSVRPPETAVQDKKARESEGEVTRRPVGQGGQTQRLPNQEATEEPKAESGRRESENRWRNRYGASGLLSPNRMRLRASVQRVFSATHRGCEEFAHRSKHGIGDGQA